MRQKIKNDCDRGIAERRAKVKVSEYNDQMCMNGVFNPICPSSYNYLTGYTEPRAEVSSVDFIASSRGKVNGVLVYNH